MNPYPSYKESGVEWIGQTPSQWELKKPKYFLHKMEREPLPDDDVITCFRDGVVTLRKNRRTTGFTNSLKEIGYQRILKGDLVVHEMDGFEGSIGVSDSVGKSTPVYTVIEQGYDYEVRYWMYLLREMSKTGFIESISRSIRERTTEFRWKMWRDLYFGVPSLQEQQQISNYLDHKTQQIDSLIEKTQQKIELLKEQRTSLINYVVTKGLNPDVEMKDSGVDWIGEIPSHWEVKRLRYLGKCSNGVSKGSEYFGEGFPFLTYSDVYKNEVIPEPSGLCKSTQDDWISYSVNYGDIFFTRTSETNDDIGLSSVCLKTIDKSGFSGFLIRFRPTTQLLDTGYSRYFFRSFIPSTHFTKEMNQVTRSSLSQELLKRTPIILPPKIEQELIRDYLEKNTTTIDQLSLKETEHIELLKEYRQSLISNVVTGKVDVRDEVLV